MNILLELTFDKLIRNTDRAFKNDRNVRASDVKITNTIFIPYINDNYLEVEAESKTDNGKYISRIVFENIFYRDEPSKRTARIVTVDGAEYYFDRINRSRSNVKVSCTCLDFHYRFAIYNYRDNALATDPPKPYVKKTDRPPVNPAKVSGVCKHIIRMVEELERDNIFIQGLTRRK
jgi:hypothetical protein